MGPHVYALVGEVARPDMIKRIMYTNFDKHITDKYGIVCENWPLERFCAPADLYSRAELQVLYQAWDSDTTTFRRLSPAELEAWKAERFDALCAQSQEVEEDGEDSASSPSVDASLAVVDSASDSVAAAAPSVGVMAVSGNALITSKPRKIRSDKGKKRGPRNTVGDPVAS